MRSDPRKKNWRIVEWGCTASLVIALFLLIPLFPGFCGDMYCWRVWSTHLWAYGLRKTYIGSGSDYLPVYQYILWHFGHTLGSAARIARLLPYLKVYTLLFELAGLYIIYRWLDRKVSYLAILLCAVLNIAYLYDTMVWGQADAIVSVLAFAGIYFAWCGRLVLSSIMMVLALNMKALALPFLPVWGILVLVKLMQHGRPKQCILKMFLSAALTESAILIPFGWKATKAIINVAIHLSGEYPKVSVSAFNLYYGLLGRQSFNMEDTVLANGFISFKLLGYLLFFTAGFFALLPMLRLAWRGFRAKKVLQIPRQIVWLTGAIVSLLFFFLLTQMHERYAHTSLIFLLIYTLDAKRPGPFILVSIAFFLNLEAVMGFVDVRDPGLFAVGGEASFLLYLAATIWLFVLLYKAGVIAANDSRSALLNTTQDETAQPRTATMQVQ